MPLVTRKTLIAVGLLAGSAGLALGAFIWSGIYNVGADDPHLQPTSRLLRLMRERSIRRHTRQVEVPPLGDPALIRQGAGNYHAMCSGCHLAPGLPATELSNGLYPSPPDFSRLEPVNPAHAFWVTKHGIKASGMPAWGRSMDDEFIWGLVAFLQRLPALDASAYTALVAASGGHSHGGGESKSPQQSGSIGNAGRAMRNPLSEPHPHPLGTPANDHAASPIKGRAETEAATVEHRHADGTIESHPAPESSKADDDHAHQH